MRAGIIVFFVILWWGLPASGAPLTCFKCHSRQEILKGKSHAPVAQGQCLRCHLPHVSRYPKLLTAKTPDLCYQCHQKLAGGLKEAPFVHAPVAKGSCGRCHEAHGSNFPGLLKGQTKELCLSCHGELKKKFPKPHAPFARGRCLSCHEAHYASDRVFLKRQGAPLCFSCHQDRKKLAAKHQVKNVASLDCLSCHDPHGGQGRGLLRAYKHQPYAKGNCQSCHRDLKEGPAMCFRCHEETRKDFYHQHNHLLGGYENNACLICHSPHVGGNQALLRDKPRRLCQKCHAETAQQRAETLYVHPKWKDCLACHLAHGSDSPSMLNGDGNTACVRCHETQGKFTHPVGKEVRDPRNGQPITCVTCHNPMGTNFKYNLRLSGEASLCLECHKNY